jgi:hypothetical protein
MRLYHGSNIAIETVDLSRGKKNKDFGQGFYATDIPTQAEFWSRRIANRYGGYPVVTELEFDFEAAIKSDLKIKVFEEPCEEWALFVISCRNGVIHDYDIVIGPVADDAMAQLFGLYDMHIIGLEEVVKGLEYKGLNSQYFFRTKRSLNYLKIL